MLFNIGYRVFGDCKEFEAWLVKNKIEIVVDVRYSNTNTIVQRAAHNSGVRYVWRQILGNKWHSNKNWSAMFGKYVLENEDVKKCLAGIYEYSRTHNICLVCACKSISDCHRKVLIDYIKDYAAHLAH